MENCWPVRLGAGFKKDDIRVLVDNHGHLRTRGERPLVGNRRSRFHDFQLLDSCSIDGIRAKFKRDAHNHAPNKSPSPPPPPAP